MLRKVATPIDELSVGIDWDISRGERHHEPFGEWSGEVRSADVFPSGYVWMTSVLLSMLAYTQAYRPLKPARACTTHEDYLRSEDPKGDFRTLGDF